MGRTDVGDLGIGIPMPWLRTLMKEEGKELVARFVKKST
jgi:hypothetical protein